VTGRSTTLDATASHDSDGTIADYRWDLDGDGVYETDGGTTATRALTFATHGAHSVGVQVVDDDGSTDAATLVVHVTDAPVPGTIAAVPSQPRPGATVGLTVSGASDPDGTIASYQWDFGDGTQTTTAIPSTSHLFATRAIRTVTVRVVDNDGASSTATYSLTVAGLAPVAALSATPSPATTGATVQFDASGSHDPDSLISDYKWDLDSNGSFELDSGTTPTAARSYPNPGLVTIRVKVTDEDGNSTIASVAVDVRGPALPGGGGGSGAGGGGSSAGGGGGSQSGGGGGAAASLIASLSGKSIQTQKAVLRKGIAISCQTSTAATCTLTVQVSGPVARRLGLARSSRKPVVIARGTVRTTGAKARTATLRISKKVASKLKRAARVTIQVVGEVRAGAAKTKVSRSILVRRR
jgi:PKD repeat protein